MTRLAEHLVDLVGKQVKLARGGPDEAKGVLLGAKEDYLILFANDGRLIHYPLQHLKSVTELGDTGNDMPQQVPFNLLDALPKTFNELLRALRGRKIKVYDHGPESSEGFLFDLGEDFVKLVVSPDEVVHYPMFHIRSVALAKQKNQQNDKNKNKDDSGEKNNNNAASMEEISRQINWVRGRDERLYYANFESEPEVVEPQTGRKKSTKAHN